MGGWMCGVVAEKKEGRSDVCPLSPTGGYMLFYNGVHHIAQTLIRFFIAKFSKVAIFKIANLNLVHACEHSDHQI